LAKGPLVVIAIATAGTRSSLLKTVESIIQQNYENLKVKIVCPPIAVEKIKEELKNNFANPSNFEVLAEKEKGQSAAINQVFSESPEADFFGWINDDDFYSQGSLYRAVTELNKSGVVAVFGQLIYVNEAGKTLGKNRLGRVGFWSSKYGPNLTPQPGSLFRVSEVTESLLLNPNHKFAMDLDLWLRLRVRGRFTFIKQTQAFMLWHQDAATVKQRKNALAEAYKIRLEHSKNVFDRLLIKLLWIPTKLIAYLSIKLI
jgi:glycosyltransferase involved in cell wall biosynthesis